MVTKTVPDSYRMPFGKYKNVPIGEVSADYLDWLAGQDWISKFPIVLQYIKENREAITTELDLDDE